MARAAREREQAAKAAERASAQAAKEAQAQHVENQRRYAVQLTEAVQAKVDGFARLLADHAKAGREFSVDQLTRVFTPRPFRPDRRLAEPTPPPIWQHRTPMPPTGLRRMFGNASYQREVREADEARVRFEQELSQHAEREQQREAALAAARAQHDAQDEADFAAVEQHNTEVAAFKAEVEAAQPTAVEACFDTFLRTTQLPGGLPFDAEIAYQPDRRRLLVDRRLPGIEAIPAEREYRYVKARDEIIAMNRPVKEIQQRYADLLGQLVLLTLRDAFAVQPNHLVDEVAVNGMVSGRNKATGQPEDLCLISVSATREQFGQFVLTELDPVECLRFLNALVSPHPWDLEPVRPIFDPDLSRYKLVDSVAVASTLDSRPVLLDMTPYEFEHLVRELFEAMGMQSWQTQPSKDDGVDAVAVNTDPVMGGVCVIQAKRYRKVVEIEAVRALAGVMEDMHASRGVLVTTSWFGKASEDFVRRHGRMQLIDGSELKYLIKQHLDKDVVPGTAKPTRRKNASARPPDAHEGANAGPI